MRMWCVMAAAMLGWSTSGCQGPAKPATVSPVLLEGEWELVALEGEQASSFVPSGSPAPWLSFSNDHRFSGFTGVNRLSAAYDQEALATGTFRPSAVATTRMAGSPEAMAMESRFLDALARVTGVNARREALVFTENGDEVLRFVPRR